VAQDSSPELGPVETSFAEHMRAFHRGLPAEEQVLLEELMALAAQGQAAASAGDVEGYVVEPFPSISPRPEMYGIIAILIGLRGDVESPTDF
jgi:hypothetical protein